MSKEAKKMSRPAGHPILATTGRWGAAVHSLLLCASFFLLLAPSAPAAFTRPFERQISGTSPTAQFGGPYGVSVDTGDNLWVSDFASPSTPPYQLDKFEAGSGSTLGSLAITGSEPPEPEGLTPPRVLAIDRSTSTFFLATGGNTGQHNFNGAWIEEFDSSGAFIRRIAHTEATPQYVAVDNSGTATAGAVYTEILAAAPNVFAIERIDAEGHPIEFSCGLACAGYVSGNKITGTPELPFGGSGNSESRPEALGVDELGDLFVVDNGQSRVAEFNSAGKYLGSFTGGETPGVGENKVSHGGFGGSLQGVAVDPQNKHVLISLKGEVTNGGEPEGAIDEFDPLDPSGHADFINQITATRPGHRLLAPTQMAFDPHGILYVVDPVALTTSEPPADIGEHIVDVYGPGAFLPTLTVAQASAASEQSARLDGTVDPEGRPLTECNFEYVTATAFLATGFEDLSSGGKAPCSPGAGEISGDSVVHPVGAEITGLTSGTTYRYRLRATSSGELSGTAATEALAFTALHAPRVEATSAVDVSSTFVELQGRIDPLGADTHYVFQYVDSADFLPLAAEPFVAATSVPIPAADIGSGGTTGSEVASVVQRVGGLRPSTTYHFRIFAANSAGQSDGERAGGTEVPHTFSTLPEPSTGLPAGRVYELVTPALKGATNDLFGSQGFADGEFQNSIDRGFASASGDQLFLQTTAAYGSFPASSTNAYVFSRQPGAWQMTPLASPSLGVQSIADQETIFDPIALSRFGLNDSVGSQANAVGSRIFNLLGPPGGPYLTVHVNPPVTPTGSVSGGTRFVGGSAGLETAVLETAGHDLCPVNGESETKQDEGTRVLCEFSGGQWHLVDVNNQDRLLSRCGASLGLAQSGAPPGAVSAVLSTRRGAVSSNGARIFFTAPDPNSVNQGSGCWDGANTNAPQLYARSGGQTVEISAPEASRASEKGHHPALFAGAAEDGSRVLFLSEGDLTADSLGIHDLELYEYDFGKEEGHRLTRISAGESGDAEGGVVFVPALAGDGGAVYFAARGQLTSDAPPAGVKAPLPAESETLNLYRYDTVVGHTDFIAQVNSIDYPNLAVGNWWHLSQGNSNRSVALAKDSSWYATPDGRFLLFASKQQIGSFDSTQAPGVTCHAPEGQNAREAELNGHCDEVYRYDSLTHEVSCLSCDPSGAPPVSNALFARSGLDNASGGPRALSEDGSIAFFDTADPLVPQDNNGTLDAYEWHEGTISLISSGHDSRPSYYLGSSPDGSNVFFGTHARLVPQDTDALGDVYDARVGGGFPPPPDSGGVCDGDACSSLVPAPNDATPGSLTFQGPGNTAECPKGKIRQKGKCVAKKQRKHHKKRQHKRRGQKQSRASSGHGGHK